jgi:hypothetical protein
VDLLRAPWLLLLELFTQSLLVPVAQMQMALILLLPPLLQQAVARAVMPKARPLVVAQAAARVVPLQAKVLAPERLAKVTMAEQTILIAMVLPVAVAVLGALVGTRLRVLEGRADLVFHRS